MIDRGEFLAFRMQQRWRWRLAWLAVIGVAIGCFCVIGAFGSYVAGLVVMVAVPLVGYDVLKRWNRWRWLRRFPELVDRDFKWIPDPRPEADAK